MLAVWNQTILHLKKQIENPKNPSKFIGQILFLMKKEHTHHSDVQLKGCKIM